MKEFVTVEELLERIAILEEKIENFKHGFEGCCTTCEPVGIMNQELRRLLEECENKEIT